jgi:hypothetical protein
VNWSVLLLPGANADLAAIWSAASEPARQEIFRALTTINERLTSDPFGQSESREDDERITFELPIGARFGVDETISEVYVLEIWRIRRPGEV